MSQPVIIVHGGAGTISPERLTPALRETFHAGLRAALLAGWQRLDVSALDAVVAAVASLEDHPAFNAGRGAVYNRNGEIEHDAAVMDGSTARAGAVAVIFGPRNPIHAARLVLDQSDHVLLCGPAATSFFETQGLSFEPPAYFATEDRRESLRHVLSGNRPPDDFERHGTVGAVALDAAGRLAAATSTGGMTGKQPGRVGDTPLIGAGTWADRHCAVSATGHGETFIRIAAAHEIAARVRLAHQPVDEAAAAVIDAVAALGGDGGVIALDTQGNAAMPFNARGMYRGIMRAGEPPRVAIHGEALQ